MGNDFVFTDKGKTIPEAYTCPNIFSFCAFMAAVVAERRGGKTSDYLSECADFMTEVVGKRLSVSDALPADYDWRLSSAREVANQMMEYDG